MSISRPDPHRDDSSPDDSAPDGLDADGAGAGAGEEVEGGAGVLRTALGALRARLSPASSEDDESDRTEG
jgi:hypothetical protein